MARNSNASGDRGGGKTAASQARPAEPTDGETAIDLNNTAPIDPLGAEHAVWTRFLQGNILNGHGRNNTVHIFLRLPEDEAGRRIVRQLSDLVTSAHKQETERKQFKDYKIPGRLFGNLFLSAAGYRKLGHGEAEMNEAFDEPAAEPRPTASNFLEGMAKHAVKDLGDPPPAAWDAGFDRGDIDAMVLLADDDAAFLSRAARAVLDYLDARGCDLARIERGTALRTDGGEGIEHFGYVDGRSQPLFLTSDFQTFPDGREGVKPKADGTIDTAATRENLGVGKVGGPIDVWNPFEPLKLVLVPDKLAKRRDCLGSYFVFRKLEQNVRDFTIAEQRLADALKLEDEQRERAGAMVVGRFRDGTPLVLNQTDGLVPPKENNFRHDVAKDDRPDTDGLKCPFQGHIRKTNPRGDIITRLGGTEDSERSRRIARRGITYGMRNRHPNAFQALDDLPSKDVGLLFMCFQASIRAHFAFMQRGWANNQNFIGPGIGIDPVIGQVDEDDGTGKPATPVDQTWRPDYGDPASPTAFFFGRHVTMKGGEFFFAPSIPYLKALAPDVTEAPLAGLLGGIGIGGG